jgi:hypothetical protein
MKGEAVREAPVAIEHPHVSGFPFIELSGIKVGNRMRSELGEEVVASPPIEVDEGRGSYFNTVYEEGGEICARTMVGRSNHTWDTWVYAGGEITVLDREDPNYEKARALLQ